MHFPSTRGVGSASGRALKKSISRISLVDKINILKNQVSSSLKRMRKDGRRRRWSHGGKFGSYLVGIRVLSGWHILKF